MSTLAPCISRIGTLLVLSVLSSPSWAWEHYGGGPGGSKFSPLQQITADNVAQLQQAWVYRSGATGEDTAHGDRITFEATPIFWQRTLYFNSSFGKLFAVDAATGIERWHFDAGLDVSKRFDETAARGVSIWHADQDEGICSHRILFGTLAATLHAVDAETGEACTDFGNNGVVDLSEGVGEVQPGSYTITSPPAIIGDTLFVGSAIGDNRKVRSERGIIRAVDVRSGAIRWSWDPIPRESDDPAFATWGGDSADISGGGNAWAPLSADPQLGLIYVPTGSASPDFYGGHRAGDNLYTNSVVALDAETGEPRWHQQLVHHDVWDYDTPAQPVLADVDLGDGPVPALVQVTKTGMMYVLDRATGTPLIPIEERPVPQQGVPGEVLSATQPFSTLPPIADHSPVTADEAFGVALFDKWGCEEVIENSRSEGIFTPPTVQGTLMRPGYAGGANWGGVALHPQRAIAVSFVNELPAIVKLVSREEFKPEMQGEFDGARMAGTPYILLRRPFLSAFGLPCVQPPWGRLVAMDLRNREILWERPLGTIADLAPAFVPNFAWGVPGMGGAVVTAGDLVFIGGVAEHKFRAIHLQTGATLWEGDLPRAGLAAPMTYEVDGRQYVAIAAGGHAHITDQTGDYLVAFALP